MQLILEDAVARYLARYDNPLSVRSYRQTLDYLLASVDASTPLHAITHEDVDRCHQALLARNLADATLASHVRKLKAFFRWCVDREYLARSPADHLRTRKRRASAASKAIPSEVLIAMMAAVQAGREQLVAQRNAAILALMVTYGVRRGDVARLTLRRINLRDGWVVFRVKGSNELRLPLPPETASVLAEWLAIRERLIPSQPHDYVFTTVRDEEKRYRPLDAESISTMIKRLSERVCGVAYGPHSIRHWFGQHQADRRIPPTLLRDIMGHSDVTITLEFYYNQDYERLRRVLWESELGKNLRPPTQSKILKVNFGEFSDRKWN